MFGKKCMSKLIYSKAAVNSLIVDFRCLSVSAPKLDKDNYKLLIVGGGSGGVTISSKFTKIFGPNNVAIVEPNDWHCNFILLCSKASRAQVVY